MCAIQQLVSAPLNAMLPYCPLLVLPLSLA